MDQSSFDRLARLLGEATDRRAGLRAALGAVFGGSAATGALAADARNRKGRDRKADEAGAEKRKKKKKTCKPACAGGFVCEKVGGKRECVCPTGVDCGAACCAAGEACENGACVPDPQPTACLEFGANCKNVGRRCCAGLTCASGQDGSYPVACYRAKGATCASTAECPFGMSCTNGACFGTPAPDNPTPDACASAGQPCGGGTGCCEGLACQVGACSADACAATNLALGFACCTSGQCASGLCWYPQTTDGDPDGTQKRCVVATGGACDYDTSAYAPCGLGNECDYDNDVCIGEYYPLSVPTGGTGCSDTVPCFSSSDYCNAGTCTPRTARQLKEQCDPATDLCPVDTTCTTYPVGSGATDTTTNYCLGNPFFVASSITARDECASFRVYDNGSGNRCTEICNVYLTSGTADTDTARGVALKSALESFPGGKFFYIEADMVGSKKYTTQQITLNLDSPDKWITMSTCYGEVQGARYVMSGGNANRVLDVTTQAGLLIQYGVFEDGNATGDGGAIRVDSTGYTGPASGSLALLDFTVRNSTATGNGGGVYSNGKFGLTSVSVTGCTAGGQGGGWYAVTAGEQAARISNTSSITGNTASGAQGAGIFWTGDLYRNPTGAGDYGAGFVCTVGSTISIATNTDASTKYDCAYGNAAPGTNPPGTWNSVCNCGYAEPIT